MLLVYVAILLERACSLFSSSSRPSVEMDGGRGHIGREHQLRLQFLSQQLALGQHWAGYSASLGLCRLIYKIGANTVFILWDYCKD